MLGSAMHNKTCCTACISAKHVYLDCEYLLHSSPLQNAIPHSYASYSPVCKNSFPTASVEVNRPPFLRLLHYRFKQSKITSFTTSIEFNASYCTLL